MNPKRILVYLHAEQASWLMVDWHGQPPLSVTRGSLADLAPLSKNSEIHVVIPSEAVLLTTATLPKLNAQRAIQAIPFALEEQLADDVNTLHFAIGSYQSDNSLPVAIVAKEKMDYWLAKLKQANIVPHTIVSATSTLPFATDNWHVCLYDNIGMVRTGKYAYFTCDRENLAAFLELKLNGEKQPPAYIQLYNFSDTPAAIQLQKITLNETMLGENQFLEYVAEWIKTAPSINLLQGIYQTKTHTLTTKRMWIAASYLAIAWVGIMLLSNAGSFFLLRHAAATSEQLINTIYYRHFPHASSVVAPRQRMEEKLKTLHATANKNTFLALLAFVSNSLTKQNDIQLTSIDFSNNQLTLSVSAAAFKSLDTLTQALTHQGLTVKQQNASVAGKTVKATLLVNGVL